MKSDLGMAHPAPVNGVDLALGPAYVTLRHLAILLIALAAAPHILQRERARQGRFGRYRTPFKQLDLVIGQSSAACRRYARACTIVRLSPLQSLQDRRKIWNPAGTPLSRSQQHLRHVSASRPNSFSRRAEPPPRPRTAAGTPPAVRGRSPAPTVSARGRPPMFPP